MGLSRWNREGKAPSNKKENARLYGVWAAMIRRCYNQNNKKYGIYGGRGIKVCDDWIVFANFKEWAERTGYDKNAPFMECTLDRIDVNGDYCPENCRWANASTQSNNKRYNRLITVDGITMTAAQWEVKNNYPPKTIYNRISKGWSEYDAVTRPMRYCKRNQVGGDATS